MGRGAISIPTALSAPGWSQGTITFPLALDGGGAPLETSLFCLSGAITAPLALGLTFCTAAACIPDDALTYAAWSAES